MNQTLYTEVKLIEDCNQRLEEIDYSGPIDIYEATQKLFKQYEGNPVFDDAIKGKQSLEESLDELTQINKGIRKILPWRKDRVHNERLSQLGELISEPEHLRAKGIFIPNNVVSLGVFGETLVVGACYAMEKINGLNYGELLSWAPAQSAVFLGVAGVMFNIQRLMPLPTQEARYLDAKIKEVYKI